MGMRASGWQSSIDRGVARLDWRAEALAAPAMRTARPRGLLHALPTLLLVALPAAVVGGGGGGGGGAAVALDFASEGAVAGDRSLAARAANAALLSALLTPARLPPGSSLTLSGGSFHLLGGARGAGLRDVTVVLDGSLVFDGDLVR